MEGVSPNQITLMPNCLDDCISAENSVRVIDGFVERLNIASLGFKPGPLLRGVPDMIRAI